MLTRRRAVHASRPRRILGVGFGLAVIVGSTLGIGILRTPGLVAGQLLELRRSILAVWIVGGLYTLLGAVCLAELGTMLPEAGGYYVYARRAFGDTVGFAVGWTDWLTYCAVLGYVSIAIGEFSVSWCRPVARRSRSWRSPSLVGLVGAAVGGRAGQQPLSGGRRRPSSSSRSWRVVVAALVFAPRPHAAAAAAATAVVGRRDRSRCSRS